MAIDSNTSPMDLAAWTMSKDFPSGHRIGQHRHSEGQLIFAVAGVMELSTAAGLWLVPPQRGIWMPPGVEHSMRARGMVSLRTLYLQSAHYLAQMPRSPKSIAISPLMREIIIRLMRTRSIPCADRQESRLLDLLIGEIEWSGEAALPLPPINDQRLQRICSAILANPGDKRGLNEWAELVGASSRTLARLFQQELGVSYLYWRQQVCAMSALPRLGAGEPITLIASDLGYETPGAFSSMFRRIMNAAPSQYFR
ncbi:AraC family transcriptional regulator [Chromobacterium violaceum]|uniref:AraC family transcriptional regulator n=2 Tax=Chromobacterium violaceum TaxID=536 RepID=UPI0009F08094|nr:helix-turn-helix transcriptional regulator [Chromobacterium violaceum]OQS27549.1 AraC family transcriptional regulator [Chromobacterium violaceum]